MKKIIIKEIDRFYSKLYKDKVISEYLMYYVDGDVQFKTSIQLGEEAKDKELGILLETYAKKNDKENYHEIIIEIIKFEEYKQSTNE